LALAGFRYFTLYAQRWIEPQQLIPCTRLATAACELWPASSTTNQRRHRGPLTRRGTDL
jgi:hypothetical protein